MTPWFKRVCLEGAYDPSEAQFLFYKFFYMKGILLCATVITVFDTIRYRPVIAHWEHEHLVEFLIVTENFIPFRDLDLTEPRFLPPGRWARQSVELGGICRRIL